MCDVTLSGRGPAPDPAGKGGLPAERRLGRNSPLPLPAFSTHTPSPTPHSSCFCRRVGRRLDTRPRHSPPTRPHALDTAAEWLRPCAVPEALRTAPAQHARAHTHAPGVSSCSQGQALTAFLPLGPMAMFTCPPEASPLSACYRRDNKMAI